MVSCWLCVSVFGDDSAEVSFRREIAPILRDNCLSCHGPKKAEGGYRVDTYEQLLRAGDSGSLPIGESVDQGSELLRRLVTDDEFERMPAESEPLRPEQIELVRKWIQAGGKFDGDDISQSLKLVIPPEEHAEPPAVYQRAIPITALAFSPDGESILTSGYHELAVWSTEDGALQRRIKNVDQRVYSIAFSADGRTLAVGCGKSGRSGEVRLVEFSSGSIFGVVARSDDVVSDVAFRPGTSELAIASADGRIRIINIDTQHEVRTIASHADSVTAVAWSDDGTRLASASRDKSAKVYDGDSGELLASYLGHGAAVRSITILANNEQVVSAGADHKLHRWNIDNAKKVAELGIGSEGYDLIRYQSSLFVPCSDKRLLHIDLTNNTVSQQFRGHHDWVLAACLAPASSAGHTGRRIATGSFDGEVRIWDIANASLIRHWIAKP